jgi:hypothetical protein
MVRPLLAFMLAVAAPAAAETPPAAPPPAGVVTGRFALPDRPVWVGEVFDLKFAWQVDWDLFRYLDGDLEWTEDPLATEGWTRDPQSPPASVGGKSIASLSFSTRAMALQPGSIRLNVARQRMQIVTGGYEEEGIRIANRRAECGRDDPCPSAAPCTAELLRRGRRLCASLDPRPEKR